MNNSHAFNAEEPLLFTPKAMDAIKKSKALLRQDAEDFIAGKPDYYRFLCSLGTDNIVSRLIALWNTGLISAGMPPKKSDGYAAAFKDCLEHCYADACSFHSLLWELYDFNAYSSRSRDELDSLAKRFLLNLHAFVVRLAKTADYFSAAYQFPKAIVPGLLDASARTIFTCKYGVQTCLAKEPEQAATWLERLASDCGVANDEFFAAYPTAFSDCRLTVA